MVDLSMYTGPKRLFPNAADFGVSPTDKAAPVAYAENDSFGPMRQRNKCGEFPPLPPPCSFVAPRPPLTRRETPSNCFGAHGRLRQKQPPPPRVGVPP